MKSRVPLILFILLSFTQMALAAETEQLDTLLEALNTEISELVHSGNDAAVYKKARFALAEAQRQKDPYYISEAYFLMGSWHRMSPKSEHRDSILYYDKLGLDYILQTDSAAAINRAYNRVSADLMEGGNYSEAAKYLFDLLEVLEAQSDYYELGNTYTNLVLLNREISEYQTAIAFEQKAIGNFIKSGKPDAQFGPILYAMVSYQKLGRLDEALEKSEKLIEIAQREGGEENNINLAKAYSWRGRTYFLLESYDEALEDYIKAWNIIKAIVVDEGDADGWKGGIGLVYQKLGQPRKAIPFMRDFINHMEERDAHKIEPVEEFYFSLSEAYKDVGQIDSAMYYFETVHALKTQRLEARLDEVKTELAVQYQTREKDATILSQSDLIRQQNLIQWLSIGVAVLFAFILIGLFLIYKRSQKTAALRQKLNQELAIKNQQNELLLKEIHHRVKNNLQTISSLLSLQSAHIEDPQIQGAVEQSQNRVQSMALIHQKLYQGENLAGIEMKEYLQNLGETLVDSYNLDTKRIEIEYPMEPVELDIDTAIPLGLIANELLTNAMKYAFPKNAKGHIRVSLLKSGDTFRFSVTDDGIGMDSKGYPEKEGFGIQLINLLVLQIEGTIQRTTQNGMNTQIEFTLT